MVGVIDRETLQLLADKEFTEVQAAEIFDVSPQCINRKAGDLNIRFTSGWVSKRKRTLNQHDRHVKIADLRKYFLKRLNDRATVTSLMAELNVPRHRVIFALSQLGMSAPGGIK